MKKNGKNKKIEARKKKRGDGSFGESVRAKWICCVFKLGFIQWMCKASLIFKSNLELALSIIKKKRIIRVKTCYGGVSMFTNMGLVILFDMFLNPTSNYNLGGIFMGLFWGGG